MKNSSQDCSNIATTGVCPVCGAEEGFTCNPHYGESQDGIWHRFETLNGAHQARIDKAAKGEK